MKTTRNDMKKGKVGSIPTWLGRNGSGQREEDSKKKRGGSPQEAWEFAVSRT